MKNLLATLFLTALGICSFAQKSPIKFGEISMDDLTMTVYDKDSAASAVVLLNYCKVVFERNAFYTEKHVRIKVLKEEGFRWADGSIYMPFSDHEGANEFLFKAATYTLENGAVKETELPSSELLKERFTRSTKLKKFTFPNVKIGSILEYTYKVKLSGIPPWEFQEVIPTRFAEFWAIISTDFAVPNYATGFIKADTYEMNESAATNTYHWIYKDVPAFKAEPLMSNVEDFKGKIFFYLKGSNSPNIRFNGILGTWEEINAGLIKYYNDEFNRAINLKTQTKSIGSDKVDQLEKLSSIYDYVRGYCEWDKTSTFFTPGLNEVFEKKTGSAADINLMLGCMLRNADFIVNMVLLSTRENGIVRKNASYVFQFNYVVCAVTINNQIILLDATEKYLPMGYLPERCINGEGFMLDKTGFRWIPTDFLPITKSTINSSITLGANSKGEISFIRDGYDALRFRKEYAEKGEEKYVQDLMKEGSWELERSEFEKVKELSEATKEKYYITSNKLSLDGTDIVYIEPLLAEQLKENPFTETERKYPINYPSTQEKIYIGKITVPDNFIVDELPKGIIVSLPDKSAKFTYSVTQLGNTISIYSNFKISKAQFAQTEYLQLKEFYGQVVAKQAEQIVLKRK